MGCRETFITQSALSKSIKSLEQELSAVLLIHAGYGVAILHLGEQFCAHISRALKEIDQAASLSAASKGKPSYRKIGSAASVRQAFLPSLLVDYEHAVKHETVFDILEVVASLGCVRLVQNRDIDLAFCGWNENPPRGLGNVPVLAQKLVVAVNPQHPLVSK